MSEDILSIAGEHLSADINPLGAELHALRDGAGRDLLWHGDPAIWAGRAPILFPIVGTLRNNSYRVHGKSYELPRHGFARRRRFSLLSSSRSEAVFRLVSDDESRRVYPFEFTLDLSFRIEGHSLSLEAVVTNTGKGEMPCSVGFHPAFLWPLPYGAERDEHRLVFEREEKAVLRRLNKDGLLIEEPDPSPVQGRVLTLRDDLFADDALIFSGISSRSLTYGAESGPCLRVSYPDTPHLGIWSKSGAPFVCIEPWQGHSDPEGFEGDVRHKPGTVVLGAEDSRSFRMEVQLLTL